MSEKSKVTELKVSGQTNPNKLGGAVVKYLDEVEKIAIRAMGDKAVNQAVKGIIVAQSFLASEAQELVVKFGFRNKFDEVLNKEITYIVFYITKN